MEVLAERFPVISLRQENVFPVTHRVGISDLSIDPIAFADSLGIQLAAFLFIGEASLAQSEIPVSPTKGVDFAVWFQGASVPGFAVNELLPEAEERAEESTRAWSWACRAPGQVSAPTQHQFARGAGLVSHQSGL